MLKFRNHSTPEMKDRFMGMVQTIWTGTGQFLDEFYKIGKRSSGNSQAECFKALFGEILKTSSSK